MTRTETHPPMRQGKTWLCVCGELFAADVHRIEIPCEGSDCPVTVAFTCAMCGVDVGAELIDGTSTWRTPTHLRDDIIARVNRGDFG